MVTNFLDIRILFSGFHAFKHHLPSIKGIHGRGPGAADMLKKKIPKKRPELRCEVAASPIIFDIATKTRGYYYYYIIYIINIILYYIIIIFKNPHTSLRKGSMGAGLHHIDQLLEALLRALRIAVNRAHGTDRSRVKTHTDESFFV